jgi:hypothetical protein
MNCKKTQLAVMLVDILLASWSWRLVVFSKAIG